MLRAQPSALFAPSLLNARTRDHISDSLKNKNRNEGPNAR